MHLKQVMFSCPFDFLTPIVKLVFEDEFIHLMDYFKNGKTTILISQVYPVCAIDPSNFKWVQLFPQVLRMSGISPFTNYLVVLLRC